MQECPPAARVRLWPITLRLGSRVLRWVFGYEHDFELHVRHILPWAMPGYVRLEEPVPADWTIGFHIRSPEISRFVEMPGRKLLVDGEAAVGHQIEGCLSFVQGEAEGRDPNRTRRAPVMCHWVPPTGVKPKVKCASVVDSGRRPHRAEIIKQLTAVVGRERTDWFGRMGEKHLRGYHRLGQGSIGNDKYLGIREHAFYFAVERVKAPDYVTEKLWDAILQEAVPIYWGAPNVYDYVLPEAYMTDAAARGIDWSRWESEYERRRPTLLAQKELVRTRFNVFSYFDHVTARPELLDAQCPITVATGLP